MPVRLNARVVKLVDTLDLGSSAARRGGSSPFSRMWGNFALFCVRCDGAIQCICELFSAHTQVSGGAAGGHDCAGEQMFSVGEAFGQGICGKRAAAIVHNGYIRNAH